MGSNATTRSSRIQKGKCSVCLRRQRTEGHATCASCRRAIGAYSTARRLERRKAQLCVRCGRPSGGAELCEPHAAERRRRRSQ